MQLDRNSYAIVDDRQTSSLTSTPDWSLVELGFNWWGKSDVSRWSQANHPVSLWHVGPPKGRGYDLSQKHSGNHSWKWWDLGLCTWTTWCKGLTHLKRPWCWEILRAGGEGDSRGWDGWRASLTQWTWIWVNSGSWWWTGRPGVLWFMGSQRVGHDWVTELNRCYILSHPLKIKTHFMVIS